MSTGSSPFVNPSPLTDTQQQSAEQERPEQQFQPGELAPCWASPYPFADLSEEEKNQLIALARLVGNKDVAARRWEVEQSWEARLFDRGYQYLLPRRGGGWILPPFATDYNSPGGKRSGMKWYGYETNIYTTYGEIVTAALTRDIPHVRFEPQDPDCDSDIITAHAATQYARVFARNNDLLDFQHQLVYYLRNDGRAIIVTDFVQDASRFGRVEEQEPVVPEEPPQQEHALVYLVRHGETQSNADDKARGRSEIPLDTLGKKQAAQEASFLKDKNLQGIICSPVARAAETAQTIAQATGAPLDVDDRFASLNIGSLAGASGSARDSIGEHFKTGEPFPGGESPQDFTDRVTAGIFSILKVGQFPVAVVTHDSVITQIMKILEGQDVPTGEIAPGSIMAIDANPDGTYKVFQVYPFQRPALLAPSQRHRPAGAEVVTCYGKLESKVPVNSMTLADMPFVQVSREYDITIAKAMFPQCADQIKPGGSTSGENELDRIARINAALGLEASYVTGDSMVRDCTIQRTWMRPSFFMEVKRADIRRCLMDKFPDGCHVIMASDTFIGARNENMDDHLTLVQAYPGSGQNRIAIMSKVLSLQKRLNNWMDLLNDYFIRTVPARYINTDVFNVEAIKNQPSKPGPFIPFSLRNTPTIQNPQQMIFVEPAPTPQPAMPQFIQLFMEQYPQLLSGALPSVFGAASDTDTATGIAIQRDQALGRLGTPWHSIQVATCSYFKQAVQLAARCRTKPVMATDSEGVNVRIALTDLRGNILAFPEQDSNFPESWNQKQARYQQIIANATGNPFAEHLLTLPSNLKVARDMAGFQEFKVPAADSYEKQMGEFEVLTKTAPLPNPQKQQAMVMALQQGNPQLLLQAQQMPDMVSSVPIDPVTDNNEIEAQACLDFINSPKGRKLRNGTAEDKAAFENVKLHFMEHKAQVQPKQEPSKPPSISVNLHDMPAEAASKLLTDQGLPATPQSVMQERIVKEASKKLGKEPPKEEQGE